MDNPLRKLIEENALSPQELEQRQQGIARLKERLSQIPSFSQRAEKVGESYWESLYSSRVMI